MLLDLLDKIFAPAKPVSKELILPPQITYSDAKENAEKSLSLLEFSKIMMLKYGDLYRFFSKNYVTTDPDFAERILKSNIDNYTRKGMIWRHIRAVLGHNAVTFVNEQWKERRKIIARSYTIKHLAKFTEQVGRESLPLILTIFKEHSIKNKTINLTREIYRVTHFSIVNFLLNYKANDKQFKRLYDWVPYTNKKSMFVHIIPTPYYFTSRIAKIKLLQDVEHMIAASKTVTKDYEDLCDMLVKPDTNNKVLPDIEIKDELLGEIIPGMLSVGSVVIWVLHAIFKNKDILAKLRREIKENLPNDANLAHEDLNKFPYCKAVINEGVRLYPPATYIPRMAINEDIFKNFKIKANSRVTIDVYSLHRNPKYWKDPDLFNPDRFLNNEVLHKYAYIPFSMGKQICVGNQLAIIEMMLIIITIVNNFDLDFQNDKLVPDTIGIMTPPLNLPCKITVKS